MIDLLTGCLWLQAAVNNEHPVAQVALSALEGGVSFITDGWGEPTIIANGAAKIWRRKFPGAIRR